MSNNHLGELRRSAALVPFGPGSVVDFRAGNAPVSAVVAGIEEWDASFPPAGLSNEQVIFEPRLQRKLDVEGFRLPPVLPELGFRGESRATSKSLVAVRFPTWLQCPCCDRLAPVGGWRNDPGEAYRYCSRCTHGAPGGQKVYVIPTRFVMACERGHLDEFPWHYWVEHKAGCKYKESAGNAKPLYLKAKGPGLAGLILSCPSCNACKSMEGIFGANVWRNFPCHGRRPWLAGANEQCDISPRILQRGASNLYFPVVESALSIPPWSDFIQESIGVHWNTIMGTKETERQQMIRILANNHLQPLLRKMQCDVDEFVSQIESRIAQLQRGSSMSILQEEYVQLTSGQDTPPAEHQELEMRNEVLVEPMAKYFRRVVRIVRLREVRALKGFTRIMPPNTEDADAIEIAPISRMPLNWLPAIEVRGEGIFIEFNLNTLREWQSNVNMIKRSQQINNVWQKDRTDRYGTGPTPRQITPRTLLVHSFAHAFMRQLTLECGYSSAALRERLYVDDEGDGMAGVLIYTATPDADGTLGGLQRQGMSNRFHGTVKGAIKAMEWCSADPLCVGTANGLVQAACHACLMSPETSCEEFNRFLDRSVLVGLPDMPDAGYFSALLHE